jgi:hypothetical protein
VNLEATNEKAQAMHTKTTQENARPPTMLNYTHLGYPDYVNKSTHEGQAQPSTHTIFIMASEVDHEARGHQRKFYCTP